MTVYVQNAGLTYVSVPKCACSSLKRFCFEVQHGAPFDELSESLGYGRLHQSFASQRIDRFLNRLADGEYGGELFTVVRNPVDRLWSCYSNKVLKASAFEDIDAAELRGMGLSATPDFAEFIEGLSGYRSISKVVARHTRPLSHFLGTDPARFLRIYDISEVAAFAELVNSRAGTCLTPQHLHRSDGANHSTTVTQQTARTIKNEMAEDEDLFGAYMTPSERICS